MEWYDGMEGYPEPNCPSLAIALDNGRMQIMRHENDDRAICVDTGMKPRRLKWNNNGTVSGGGGIASSVKRRTSESDGTHLTLTCQRTPVLMKHTSIIFMTEHECIARRACRC